MAEDYRSRVSKVENGIRVWGETGNDPRVFVNIRKWRECPFGLWFLLNQLLRPTVFYGFLLIRDAHRVYLVDDSGN
jgi:hypothetical protein